MTATDAQVRIIMREREKGRTQEQAAASANVSNSRMRGMARRGGNPPRFYLYYCCAATIGALIGKTCNVRSFRADHVDRAVWDWVRSLFTDMKHWRRA